MQALKGNGKCKSCGCHLDPGEIRCVTHERQFKRWLAKQDGEREDRGGYYTPRVDGIKGFCDLPPRAQLRRTSIIRELQPEARLNFS